LAPRDYVFRPSRLQRVQPVRVPAGPGDPLSELGTRLHRLALGFGAALHFVDEGADLLGLGPGFDLELEELAALELKTSLSTSSSGRFAESADYNTQAPHAALGFRSPADYRAEQVTASSPCAQ
jgi:hypothetical protein